MAKDYYKILEISPQARLEEIENAYRRLSVEWHPKHRPSESLEATHKFHEIAEAFEVLREDSKRGIYDAAGEFGLKEGFATKDSFSGGYRYAGNAQEIFDGFFGHSNPYYQDFRGTDVAAILSQAGQDLPMVEEAPPEDILVSIECTLEELYHGSIKEISYTKRVLNEDDITFKDVEVQRKLLIERGNKADIVFKGEGHQSVRFDNSHLVIRVTELPHHVFTREGDNLVCLLEISLTDALTAKPVLIDTLDKRTVSQSFHSVINPYTQAVIPGEGMFKDRKTDDKGDLIIKFRIVFPKYIPEQDKITLATILVD